MRLTANFAFLVTFLVVFFAEVNTAPMKRNARSITIPIRSIHGHNRRDLHPQLVRPPFLPNIPSPHFLSNHSTYSSTLTAPNGDSPA